jgi:hypothetical protein
MESEASLETLDAACMLGVCSTLDSRSVAAMQCVSRALRVLTSEDALWRDMAHRDWELAEPNTPAGEPAGSFR